MSKSRARWMLALSRSLQAIALATAMSLSATPLVAEPKDEVVMWLPPAEAGSSTSSLRIKLGQLISKKQQSVLASGFTTFSHASVFVTDDQKPLAIRSCTVKFDLWEETYHVTVHGGESKHRFVSSLSDYASNCLAFDISDQKSLEALTKHKKLLVSLQIEQISADQAAKIKDWLVQHQSAFMQGLFSHMLGDMTLSQQSRRHFRIPPRQKEQE